MIYDFSIIILCVLMYAYIHTYRRPFYEKRMSTEMAADFLGDEWKVCGIQMMMYTSEVWGMCVNGIFKYDFIEWRDSGEQSRGG